MVAAHDRIIAAAARERLAPLGFVRKGRSRTWLADRGWWLAVVEFQPSRFAQGCYLNVGAHFLWSEAEALSFDHGGRVAEFVGTEDEAAFAGEIAALAERAAGEAARLCADLEDMGKAADLVAGRSGEARASGGHPGWIHVDAGILLALTKRSEQAEQQFAAAIRAAPMGSLLHDSASRLAALVDDEAAFRAHVSARVAKRRELLALPAADDLRAVSPAAAPQGMPDQ